jgi:tetratricopeptide (TPR) repeat protein
VVVAAGPGGCGKTWLGVKWARRRAEAFPGGQLFVDLRGFDGGREPLPVETALHGFLLALGTDPSTMPVDLDGLTGLYRSLTSTRRLLVVADNARTCEQVRPLIPAAAGSALLVTSRSQLPGLVTTDGARPLPVDTLGTDDAIALLAAQVGSTRLQREGAAVRALLRQCAGLPLALGIVAGRAALAPQLPLAALAAQLDDADLRLEGLADPVSGVDLRASLACTLGSVRPEARDLFALLGLVPSQAISVAAAGSLVGAGPTRAAALLHELASAHLVEVSSNGQYRLHDLVRLFAESLAGSHPRAAAAVRGILGYGAEVARSATDGPAPADSPAWRHVATEDATLAALVDLALARGEDAAVCDVVHALSGHYSRQGRWRELTTPATAAYDAAARHGDAPRMVVAAVDVGRAHIGAREYASATHYLTLALRLAEPLADARLLADAHRANARLSARQARPDEALRHDDRALVLYAACGDRIGEATALNAIGWHLAHLGRPARSLLTCRRALRIFEEEEDLLGQTITLDSIGLALHQLGRYDDAADHYARSIELAGRIGHDFFRAESIERLAALEQVRGA